MLSTTRHHREQNCCLHHVRLHVLRGYEKQMFLLACSLHAMIPRDNDFGRQPPRLSLWS